MIDVPTRLRRAIACNDLTLVKRILKNNPSYLTNPDFADKCNTSLHLAAQYGFLEIVEYLVSLGHDATLSTIDEFDPKNDCFLTSSTLGISHNVRGQTPLHLAASQSHLSLVKLLTTKFPECINRPDYSGMTPLMLAARGYPDPDYVPPPQAIDIASRNNGAPIQAAANAAGLLTSRMGQGLTPSARTPASYTNTTSSISQIPASNAATVEHFLRLPSSSSSSPSLSTIVSARDATGNTALHHATASGNLKVIRSLIYAGADPLSNNNSGWQPQEYSVSIQAEVYYKGLVSEWRERATRPRTADGTRTGTSKSPEKIKLDTERVSDELNRIQKTRRRQGTIGGPSPTTTQSPSSTSANLTGMGKGGLRLVMPDEDDDDPQPDDESIRHHSPYPTFTQNPSNTRSRGMTDTSHGSSATVGSGSTDLSSGSSRSSTKRSDEDGQEQLVFEDDDEDDDGTETARNSMYQVDETDEGIPQITMSPMSSPPRGLNDGGIRPKPLRLRRPSRLAESMESSSISTVTPTGPDLWK